MSYAYKRFEVFLVEKLEKMFLGMAGVMLPQMVTVKDILYPGTEILRQKQVYHPLCTFDITCADESTDPCRFSLVHFVNGQGLTLPDSTIGLLQALILGMYIILIHTQMDLPQYDQLFPELTSSLTDKKCTEAQVKKGMLEILRMAAVSKVFTMFDSFDCTAFQTQNIFTTEKIADEVRSDLFKVVKKNLKTSGLGEVGFLDPDIKESCFSEGFACPGHSSCWKEASKISEITPNWFAGYSKFITSFQLGANQLTSLPPELFQNMPQLKVLNLHSNYLDALPDTIGHCKSLMELVLGGNNLFDLPPTLDSCKELRSLDISLNCMELLPPIITKLYNLTHLYAHGLMLTSLPDNFGNLSKLNVLNLNENCLTKLPKSFSMLQNLRELYLAGISWIPNKINNFLSKQNFEATISSVGRWLDGNADIFGDNDMFQYFDLDGSGTLDTQEISRANAILYDMFPRFGYKGKTSPDDKTWNGFPEEIFALKNLSILDLQYQGIVHVPKGIQNLENLTTLQLNSNPYLLSIAAETGQCPLQHLNINDCPLLKTPPKEIRERGFTTTYAYLKRLLTGSVDCKRTKLMLVGLGGAGKTSLVKALLKTFGGESPLTGSGSVTDGIDICTWDVDYKGETISYSVWDFAGQTVYYNTHQFFLSDRAVYLLLWNIRLGHEHAGLNFWLNSITVHAPKAPIFVVGTHMDQMTKIALPMDEMRQSYHQIEGFHFVSSKNGNGIPDLKEALFKATLQQDYMGEKIPQVWLQLESNIASKRVNQSINVMDYKDIQAEALQVGIINKTEVTQAIQFLHDLGMVQHFQNEYLKDRVVINPQWIVDVMACVVSVKQTVVKDGQLMHSDIYEVWKEYKDMASWLLKLTEEFDLTYPLEGESCNIVPCLLPEKQPDFEWPEVKKGKRRQKILETKLVYTFDYLPAGLFNRGQVRLYGISDQDILIWKRGTFLKKNGQIALVQQIGDSELNVKVQGPQPDNLLFLIYEVFEGLIKESFQGVTYECKIPCPDCVKQFTKFPHMFPASVVRRAVEVKAPFLQCHKHFHSTPVLDLQGILAPDDNADYDLHMSQDLFSLQQMQEALTVDIFISYCIKDAPKNRSKVIHPADVCVDLEQEGYTCFCVASREKQLLLVFASNNYAANDICSDVYKYAVNTIKKPTIIVAVGENFDWKQSTTLGVFMSDVVFVNMINSKKDVYKNKFAELLSTLQKNEQLSLAKPEASNACFISYSWVNSQTAVSMGSKFIPGAVGKGDPRKIKSYLDSRGICCWLDVEQVNVNDQLFARIAKGLSEARVMVACVSDEYAKSDTCVREMKFATQLNLPIVIAVVGTGTGWLNTEIGLLATTYPKVNFQNNPNEETMETLFRLVQDNMKPLPSKEMDSEVNKDETEENYQISYQEMYELAQRKLLRQVSKHASTHDIGSYPRLFVVDIEETSSDVERTVQYHVHTLCECDQGWHSVADPIVLSTVKRSPDVVDEDSYRTDLEDFTPYLSRVAVVMEHNSGFVLNLFTSAEGQRCLKRIQELAMICSDSFQTSYHKFRVKVHELDTKGEKGKLNRCRLPSGRIIWLCEEHSALMKVTVLSEEVSEVKHMVANQPWLDAMLDYMRNGATKHNPFEFKNNRKAKRKLKDMIAGVDDVVRNIKKTLLHRNSSLNKAAQLQALSEIKSQDPTFGEETTDSTTSKKKKEKKKEKKKKQDDSKEVEEFSKASNSQDATAEQDVDDSISVKKKKKKKKRSNESPDEYSEEGKHDKDVNDQMTIDGPSKSVSPDPIPLVSSRTATPHPESDLQGKKATSSLQPDVREREAAPSTQPRTLDQDKGDKGQDSDQQPSPAKSKTCVVL
ncbi:uncharacterized protein LOC132546957 [Ylistrum balloti]|uniref:uncharacterized protein LOC132546957 n=1 Tax=Ylistrum balloti TaxID=509963 RepID=UPI0029059FF5|nr:uncharacterized protein LOC132546957 [Ylistrum balloti]